MTRCVLITGGGGGFGPTVARHLARIGWQVMICDKDGTRAALARDEALSELRTQRVLSCAGDIATMKGAHSTVEWTLDQLGGLDAIVNMVGWTRPASLLELAPHEWHKILDLNLSTAYYISLAGAEFMLREDSRGALIHFSSGTAYFGSPGNAAYSAAKAGLNNLIKSMSIEWAPDVRVNGIAPVITPTSMGSQWLSDAETRDRVLAAIPVGRVGRTEDVTGVIEMLLSEQASFITGQTIIVDGGMTASHPFARVDKMQKHVHRLEE
jgi:gluconate 5-dehydrogenase